MSSWVAGDSCGPMSGFSCAKNVTSHLVSRVEDENQMKISLGFGKGSMEFDVDQMEFNVDPMEFDEIRCR